MSEAETVPLPKVHLPPAASRLDNLEFDATGIPYFKFPPFPSPPDGVKIIPFDEFKPSGIQITLGEEEEELDGEGIPTVELHIKHEITDSSEKKKKKKKVKHEDEGPRKPSPWWVEWEEGEDLRGADCYDPNTPRIDRFVEGASQFAQNRKWPAPVHSLYTHFSHYVGLLGSTSKLKFGKGEHANNDADEDEEDEEELKAEEAQEEQASENPPLSGPINDNDPMKQESGIFEVSDEYERQLQAEQEAKEMRIDAFLNDPEQSMKIFFSSFYKDKGLFWSESRLRDGPKLLSFFLNFFIRNNVMPDYTKALMKAGRVVGKAQVELPQTSKISMAIPDTFGRACMALWGSKRPRAWGDAPIMDTNEDVTASESAKEWEEQLKTSGAQTVNIDVNAATNQELSGWGVSQQDVEKFGNWGDNATNQELNGWGVPQPMEGVERVGDWGDNTTNTHEEPNPWVGPMPGSAMDWGATESTPSLLDIFGPTMIPLTHDVQLVEKSVRQIVSCAPPNPDAKGLGRVLGTVLLTPWKRYTENGTISRPELVTERPEGSTFDPAKDLIQVYVDAEVVAVLIEGMGLSATFVQVVEKGTEDASNEKKKSKSKGRGKAKSKGGDDKEWWYIEFLYEVLPSFWEEQD